MEQPSGPGVIDAASPPAPDFSTYERTENARDVARGTPTTTPADPSPAPSGEQSASTDATTEAGSAPAPPPDKTPRNLQTRTQQVDAEVRQLQERLTLRKALRQELDALDRPHPATPAAPQPATPTTAEWQKYRQLPDAPTPDEFESYEDFVVAQAVFVADRRFEERDTRASLDAQSRERVSAVQQTIAGFHERLGKAREADPAFDTKVDPGLLEIVPAFALKPGEPLRPANVLLQACVESDAATDLLVHFSTPEGQAEWGTLAQAVTPAAMLRAFGRIEARFLSDGPSPAAPAAKPVTSAPAPPVILGRKPPTSPDRAGSAVKAGDYRAYEAAADAADLAVRRR